MKKFFLLNLLLTSLVAGLSFNANAQFAQQNFGGHFIVNSPASQSGPKTFTYSSNPVVTAFWGGALGSHYHVPVANITDSLVSGKLSPADSAKISGKWALIFRGQYFFSDKAYYCWLAHAQGVIIVNNVPGADPINMAANTSNNYSTLINIPVIMISNTDGLALNNNLYAGGVDTISISPWGFGLADDLAMLSGSTPVSAYGAIPLAHVTGANGLVSQYNMFNIGTVANIGTNAESNVVIHNDLYFTPTGGAKSQLRADTLNVGSILVSDSLKNRFNDSIYHPVATQKGRYDMNSYVSFGATDLDPNDDTLKTYSYITDSVFCMGRWDPVASAPMIGGETGGGSTTNYIYGPLFFLKDGPYRAAQVQLAILDNDTTNFSRHNLTLDGALLISMFKWVDGSNSQAQDGIIQGAELTKIGTASKTFTANDSNYKFFTVPINDPAGDIGTTAYTEPNSTYFFAVDMPSGFSLVSDDRTNYWGRLVASELTDTLHFFGGEFQSTSDAFTGAVSQGLDMIPFVTSTTDPTQVSIRDFDALTPAMAFYTSKNHQNSVQNVAVVPSHFSVYPNPAVGTDIHVKLDLPTRASKVYFNIMNAVGRGMMWDNRSNLQNEDIAFSTSNLPAGQYYMFVIADGVTMSKPFTVLSK